MPNIAYAIGLDANPALAALSGLKGALAGVGGAVGGMVAKVGAIAGLAGGLGLVGAAVAGFKKSIDEASTMEGFVVGFKVLLGSAEAATARMKELSKFAADTPFELPEVAAASRTLETLTKGALATGKGLTLVGDVASGTQQSFAEIATWVGRLYDGLQSGRPVGEAMARMQELGIVSGDTRAQIEQLQAAGQKGDGVWGIMEAALGRFGGMMKEQSNTWAGLMSTLKDGVNGVFREFGTPILPALKPLLVEGIALTDTLAVTAKKWGEQVAWGIGLLRNASGAGRLGELVGLSLKVGFGDAIAFLAQKLSTTMAVVGPGMTKMFHGLSLVFAGITGQIGAGIAAQLAEVLNSSTILGRKVMSDESRDRIKGNAEAGQAAGAAVMKIGLNEMGAGQSFLGDFLTGLNKDTTKAREQLADLVAALMPQGLPAAIEAAKTAASAAAGISPASTSEATKMQTPSDRLAKIGGFIGGDGGVRGQRAAEDTARNTRALIDKVTETNRLLTAAGTAKDNGGATF